MSSTRGRETVRVTKVKEHAEDVDGSTGSGPVGGSTGLMLRLRLLLTWVVVISLKSLLMLGVGRFGLVVIGILSNWIYIGL